MASLSHTCTPTSDSWASTCLDLDNPRSLEHLRAVLTLTVRPTFVSLSSSLWAGCSHLLLLPSAWSSALGTTTTHDPPVFCRGPCLAFLPPTGEPGAEVCGPQEVRQVGTGVLPGVLPWLRLEDSLLFRGPASPLAGMSCRCTSVSFGMLRRFSWPRSQGSHPPAGAQFLRASFSISELWIQAFWQWEGCLRSSGPVPVAERLGASGLGRGLDLCCGCDWRISGGKNVSTAETSSLPRGPLAHVGGGALFCLVTHGRGEGAAIIERGRGAQDCQTCCHVETAGQYSHARSVPPLNVAGPPLGSSREPEAGRS